MTFLFYTCAKFDRWEVPSPVVVPPSYAEHFERALSLFRLVDQRRDFVALFDLDSLRTKLYQDAAIVPGRAKPRSLDLEAYRKRISEIPAPTMPQQRPGYTERRLRLERLLNGLEHSNLKSALVLNLPYALHHQTIDADFDWQGIHTKVSIQPILSYGRLPGIAFEVPGAAMTRMHVSRWQGAMSSVRIQIDGLLDPSYYTPSLRSRAGDIEAPYEGWPSGHAFAFLLLYDLAWELPACCTNPGGMRSCAPRPYWKGSGDCLLLQSLRWTNVAGLGAAVAQEVWGAVRKPDCNATGPADRPGR
jgi:hypothetical protein